MRRVVLSIVLCFALACAVTTKKLEKWIDEVATYQRLALFYNEEAHTWGHGDMEPPKVPSESFIAYSKRIVQHRIPLEALLLKRYRESGDLHAAKLYVVLGNPSSAFIDPIWKKSGKKRSYQESAVIELAAIYNRTVMKPYLKKLFSDYPVDRYDYNLRSRIVREMLHMEVDSLLITYAMQIDLTLLHHIKDTRILPLLVERIESVTNGAHRMDMLRAIVQQVKLYPESYNLVAGSSVANAKDIERMISIALEKKSRSHYKRKVPKVLVSLALNFGDSTYCKHAEILFGHACKYRTPDSMSTVEKRQLELFYRKGRGYGAGYISTRKPEHLQAWQKWFITIEPDSEQMRLRLIYELKKLKLSSSTIYNHLKQSDRMSENEALVDSLLKGGCDIPFVKKVINNAPSLADTLHYRIFYAATSKPNINECGETLIDILPAMSVKSKVMFMSYIKKLGKHKAEWDRLIREKLLYSAKEREKVPLNRFINDLYGFTMSDMDEELLLKLLNHFRNIPEGPTYTYCLDELYRTFVFSIDKIHTKGKLSQLYSRVLAKTHRSVASRADLQKIAVRISRYKPFTFSF